MYTLIRSHVDALDDSTATVVLEVLETESELGADVTITVDVSGTTRPILAIACELESFEGPELEGFVRSVHPSTCLRIASAQRRGVVP